MLRSLALLSALAWGALLASPAMAQDRQVTIGASGDVLVHLRVISAAQHGSWDRVMGELGAIVREDEIAFANLETPLSVERPPVSGEPPVLGAPTDVAAALGRAGIDVLSLANNHSWDQYAVGMARTIEAVEGARVARAGAAIDAEGALAPAVIERNGLRVGFVAITERINGTPNSRAPASHVARWTDDATVIAALERAREHADVLVVSIHWSHDFWDEPTLAQRRRAQLLVDHGADLILGHGPHVLHAVERLRSPRGDALCAYSLGNLLSNQGMRYRAGRSSYPGAHRATWEPGSRDGVWLRTSFAREGDRLRITRVEGVPLFTYNNYFARLARTERGEDIRIQRLASVSDDALREERRAAIARALGPEVTLAE